VQGCPPEVCIALRVPPKELSHPPLVHSLVVLTHWEGTVSHGGLARLQGLRSSLEFFQSPRGLRAHKSSRFSIWECFTRKIITCSFRGGWVVFEKAQ
jgi:hypothetical protein